MFDWLLSNSGLASIIAFAIVLIPVVIIHELGHFFAGKSVGITILEFGIGFPPRIGRLFVWRGTEFTLNWLPLGGFVRPLGEDFVSARDDMVESDREQATSLGIEKTKSVEEAKPLERIWFLSAGAIFNLITAFILFIIIGLMGIPGIRLQVVGIEPNSPLRESGLQVNDAIESVNGTSFVYIDDFVAAFDANQTHEMVVRRGEDGASVDIAYTGTVSSLQDLQTRVYIIRSVEDSPAFEAGLRDSDVIVRFNDESVTSVQQLIELTSANLGQEVVLGVQRGSETFETRITPRENPPEGQGAMGIEINGVFFDAASGLTFLPLFDQVIVPLSFGESVRYSIDRFSSLFMSIVRLPAQIASGAITAQEARPVSIVGISQVGGVFLQQSIEQERPVVLLNYFAVISIALGLTNLLPLPALDGGRILFVLIELVRGRPIAPEREHLVHLLGLIFLLSLTVIIVINDIVNPITNMLP